MQDTKFPGDGVITGHGTVDGRPVFVFAKTLLFLRVAGRACAENLQDHGSGHACRCPGCRLKRQRGRSDTRGGRPLAGYADIFLRNTLASGRILN